MLNRPIPDYFTTRDNISFYLIFLFVFSLLFVNVFTPFQGAWYNIQHYTRAQLFTDTLIIVVRYYGGVNLGTGGLIVASREAAADAIAHAKIETRQVEELVSYTFAYPLLNDVMRVVKELSPRIVEQQFDNTCQITLAIRKSEAANLRSRLEKLSFGG